MLVQQYYVCAVPSSWFTFPASLVAKQLHPSLSNSYQGSIERLKRLTRAISLRRTRRKNSPDRSTGLETPMPSEACKVCAILRDMFAGHSSANEISLKTLETTCSGHGPLFDFLQDEISQEVFEVFKTRQRDTTNSGAGESSERTEEVKESKKRKEIPRDEPGWKRGIKLYEILFLGDSKGRMKIKLRTTGTRMEFSWELLMVRSCYEPQTPGFGRVLDPEWVDLKLARRWKRRCFAKHKDKCRNPLRIGTVSPAWVIDTTNGCIVPGESISEYVALSYRWGVSAGFRTTRHLLKALQEPGAFSQGSNLGDTMTPILQHAIGLTQAIDERYLWVDAICIVQDDEKHCTTQLELMGAIYATAKLTIVASDGNAMDGISGLKGISPPRQVDQKFVPVLESERLFFHCPPSFRSGTSEYFDRGWTYQEYHLSQRRLTFAKGQIYWHCTCAEWEEAVIEPKKNVFRSKNGSHFLNILQRQPNFEALNELLSEYNGRHLSFPEDALPGISGLLSILTRSFEGGFLFGLPEIAFDSALMWRSPYLGNMEKREDSGKNNLLSVAARLPSWSWVSWKCARFQALDEETLDTDHYNHSWTIPITHWFTHRTPEAIEKRPIHSDWFRWRERFNDIAYELPKGWTREKCSVTPGPLEGLGQYWYRHAAMPNKRFWFPVPTTTVDEEMQLLVPAQTPYISCNTKRGRFQAAQLPISHFPNWDRKDKYGHFHAGMLDASGNYCGRVYLQGLDDISRFPEADSRRTCDIELVAICRRREVVSEQNCWRIDEPVGSYYHPIFKDVYGVLWVEWTDGIAYRRASGIVDKDAWEGHDLEDVHLVLG